MWGLGRHAFKNILPAIDRFDGVRLAGVCSRNWESRRLAVSQWGGAEWESPADMLTSAGVDIVYVATPTGLHFSHGMDVLRAEKHLVCEKSLTSNLEDSERLIEFAALQELVICEALMFEYHPQFLALADLVRHSDFGKALHAFCCFSLPALPSPGFRSNRDLGGGALLDLGCYPAAIARGLFGDMTATLSANLTYSGDIDTSGEAALRFGDTRVDLAWGYDRAYTAEVLILGEKQSAYAHHVFSKAPAAKSEVMLRDSTGAPTSIEVPGADAFVEMFKAVLRAMESDDSRERLRSRAASQLDVLRGIIQCAK